MSNANQEKLKGNDFFAQKDFLKAIHHYNKALEIDPSLSIVYGNRGLCYLKLGKYKEAIEDSTKAIEIDPNYSKPYHRRGLSYFYIGLWKDSLEDFKQFMIKEEKIEPKIEIENYFKSINNSIHSLDLENLDSCCAEVEFEVGNFFKQQGKIERSIEYYTKAITLKKKEKFFFTRGTTNYYLFEKTNDERYLNHALKDLDESLILCKELHEQEKRFSLRGNIYFAMKKYQEALEDFQRAYKIQQSEDNLLDVEKAKKYIQKESYQSVKLPDSNNLKKITKNPEIMEELSDPVIRRVFERIKKYPYKIRIYLQNERFKRLMDKITKEVEK